jgi:hypothetical protein
MQRARLHDIALKRGVIVRSISQQSLQMMGNRVEQFNHRLVLVPAGGSEQEAQDQPAETDHT